MRGGFDAAGELRRKDSRTMIWRDTGASATGEIDPEGELELRLIAHAHAGAAWALSSLVARYQPPVVRYLIRLTGDQEHAHALAEQIFVRMARRLRGPHRGEHLRLWLLRTCTEVGLDVLRRPAGAGPARLAAPARSTALLPGKVREGAVTRLFQTFGVHYRKGNTPRPVPPTQEFVWSDLERGTSANGHAGAADVEMLSPREQVRHRLIRAVLAELTYSDAQCLALHLVAGLNQTEVALALGVTAPIARRRIVQGLQLFGRRYDATLASLGLPRDFVDADVAHVRFTETGAMIARGVPDETGAPASDESEALRREREVTGTLVVPNPALPALEEFFANEPAGPALADGGAVAADATETHAAPVAPGPLDPGAAVAVYMPLAPTAAAETAAATAAPAEPALAAAPSTGADVPFEPYDEAGGVSAAAVEDAPTTARAPAVAESLMADGPLQTDGPGELELPERERMPAPERHAGIAWAIPTEPARVVPVLAAAAGPTAARPTRPLTAPLDDRILAGPPAAGGEPAGFARDAAAEAAPDAERDGLLIEWDSNPQIPIHVRSDLNALLGQQDVAAPGAIEDNSDWLLVLEDERGDSVAGSLETRRRRMISADGEAEDPDDSGW
jgi:DNA-directed RNA polymerase specialized sigma24 family protein